MSQRDEERSAGYSKPEETEELLGNKTCLNFGTTINGLKKNQKTVVTHGALSQNCTDVKKKPTNKQKKPLRLILD